jgi:outer membrane protein OmpA-like peptidoglycan-associated protein
MMIAALLALAAGAVAGIFLAVRHFRRKRLPAAVALFHGLGGATGFALVLLTVVREPNFRPIREVLYLLIATVALGVVNLLFHIRKVRHRTSLILLHGFTAVTAASMLIRAILVHVPPEESSGAATAPPPVESSSAAPPASAKAPEESAASAGAASADSPGPAEKPAAQAFAVDEGVERVLKSPIQFDTASANISADSLSAVSEIATTLKEHPEITLIQVQGHADERGDENRNLALTRARAAAVVSALVAKGVERARLHAAGYGSRCPEDSACAQSDAPESCHAAENWQRDRRVVFRVLRVKEASYSGEVVCARGADLIPTEDRKFHVAK